MKYICDNDLHIHSKLSICSNDEEQTTERILAYAEESGLKTVCIADHFWDENVDGVPDWYQPQDFKYISLSKPLPQSENVRFLFGCETELKSDMTLGISRERFDEFDFVVIPTTHFHFDFVVPNQKDADVNERAKLWVERFESVLNMDLPFHKIGIAHLTTYGIVISSREKFINVLNLLEGKDLKRLFTKAAEKGCGIEINAFDMKFSEEESESILRIYRIAKQCGCKFYFGSDAHHPKDLDDAKALFEKAIELLELKEEDKFQIVKEMVQK